MCLFISRQTDKTKPQVSISVHMFAVVMFFVCLSVGEGSSCTRRISTQLLTYKDCVPKRVFTHSCVGSCITHAQVSPTNPLVLEHTCYQCKEAVIKLRRVRMRCPNPEGPKRFRSVTIEVPVPQECMCQLCSFQETVNVTNRSTDTDINT